MSIFKSCYNIPIVIEIKYFINAIKKGSVDEVERYYKNEYLNEIYETKRPIHYAAENNCVEILKFLLDKNCDIETEDKQGLRAIHLASSKGYEDIVNILAAYNCNTEAQNKNNWRPIHYAASVGHAAILRVLMNHNCDMEAETKDGLRISHFAANGGYFEIIEMLIDHNYDMEAVDVDGFRPIHYAASKGHLEILRLLIEYNCDIDSRTKKNQTALDLATEHRQKEGILFLKRILDDRKDTIYIEKVIKGSDRKIVMQILEKYSLSRIISNDSAITIFDLITERNDEQIIDMLRKRPVNAEEIIDWGEKKKKLMNLYSYRMIQECLLYRCIRHANESAFNTLCSVAIVNSDTLFMGPSVLETVAEYNRLTFVDIVLSKLITVDEAWTRAIDNAQRQGYKEMASIISRRQFYLDFHYNNGYSRLHLAVFDNDSEVVEYIMDNRYCNREDCVQILPRCLNIDPGISILIKRPCLRKVTHEDTLLTLCLKINGTIYPCLLNHFDQGEVNRKDGEENTLLHLSASFLLPDVCSQLLLRGANVDSRNAKGCTPLLEMLELHECVDGVADKEDQMIKTANILLDNGASINVEGRDGHNLLERATNCCSERLLLTLVRRGEPIECICEPQLVAWFQNGYLELLRQTMDHLKITVLQKWITCEVMEFSMAADDMSLTMAMFERADKSVSTRIIEKLLYKAAHIDDEALFKRLIDSDISNESHLDGGHNLFHTLIKERNIKYCQLILHSQNVSLLVEKKNADEKLPLHVCIENNVQELMDALIIETKGVNNEDRFGCTPLSLLLKKLNSLTDDNSTTRTILHIKMLINKSADIYKINKFNIMIITFCDNLPRKNEIEHFYNNHKTPNQASDAAEEMICRICMNNRIDCVFECGHVLCMTCGRRVFVCPMCRHEPTNPKRMLI